MSKPAPYPFSSLVIQKGIAHIDERPRLLVTADYPYYRDYADNWPDRLMRLKSLGITVITAYIPWRHHQLTPDSEPDFTGRTEPSRDVLGFLEVCRAAGVAVIAKPGPFIHAETNYGGLPDWVCPLNNPHIESLLDAQGQAATWAGAQLDGAGQRMEDWPLPAPFDSEFMCLAREWLARVGEYVIRPNRAPGGPIVAVQVGNEGIYSNGQHAPWAYDYSPAGLTLFREYLRTQYETLENYNHRHGTQFSDWDAVPAPRDHVEDPLQGAENALAYLDWGAFQAEYMERIFRAWAESLDCALPVIVNQNPPLAEPFGEDAWLTRVEPERWPSVHYGFTNWIGDVSANAWAFDRYLLTAKRFPGINMEENWGFAELYDPAYADAAISFYQTLLALNGGATGFNVYTGVATARPDPNLEVIPKAPYPDAAPITADGGLTPKAETVRWLAAFMDRYGDEFLACQPVQPVAWGLYLPHAHVGAWKPEPHASHGRRLREFQSQMRALHLDYGLLNLQTASLDELLRYPRLALASGEFMERAVQEKLADYVRRGGRLALLGDFPRRDEGFGVCEALAAVRSQVRQLTASALRDWLADAVRPLFHAGEADVWVRSHPKDDLHFVTILIPAQGKSRVVLSLPVGTQRHQLSLSATPSGGAILRLRNGWITDIIIKGHNAYLGRSVVPQCSLDSQIVGLDKTGDYARIGDWTASLHTQPLIGEKNLSQR